MDEEKKLRKLILDLEEKMEKEGLLEYCVIVFKKDTTVYDLFKNKMS
jgi:hypothetical protein